MDHTYRYDYEKRPARRRTGLSFGEVILLVIAIIHLLVIFRQDVPTSYTAPEFNQAVNMKVTSQPPRQLEL